MSGDFGELQRSLREADSKRLHRESLQAREAERRAAQERLLFEDKYSRTMKVAKHIATTLVSHQVLPEHDLVREEWKKQLWGLAGSKRERTAVGSGWLISQQVNDAGETWDGYRRYATVGRLLTPSGELIGVTESSFSSSGLSRVIVMEDTWHNASYGPLKEEQVLDVSVREGLARIATRYEISLAGY